MAFFDFSNGGRPPSSSFKILTAGTVQKVNMRHCAKFHADH